MKKLLLTTVGLAVGLGAFSQTIVSTTPANKHIVLEELTGKKCGYCPDGHRLAQNYSIILDPDWNKEHCIVVAHVYKSSPDYEIIQAEELHIIGH